MFNRALRLSALTLGFSCFGGAAYGQAANPDLEVKSVSVASQDGRRASINVFGIKKGAGPNRAAIKVYWKTGNTRREIFSGNGQFNGTDTGFQNTFSVDLPEDSGQIEVEAAEIGHDPVPGNNKKVATVGGSDLDFETATIETIAGGTPNRKFVVTVANNGPGNLAGGAGCHLIIDITPATGAVIHKDITIPAMPKRAKFQKKVEFNFAASNVAGKNRAHSLVTCPADPIQTNNAQDTPLR